MKFLVFTLLMYFAYRTFVRPLLPQQRQQQQQNNQEQQNFRDSDPVDDSDYIDYEEVE